MKLDIHEYNCIDTNDLEGILGYADDIVKLYKDYLKQLIDDTNRNTIEDLKTEIDMVLELIDNIYKNIEYQDNTLIAVRYNPMGAYYYEKYEVVE